MGSKAEGQNQLLTSDSCARLRVSYMHEVVSLCDCWWKNQVYASDIGITGSLKCAA